MKQVLVFILIACSLNAAEQIEYAKQMAVTIMNQYKDSMVVKKYVSHLLPGQVLAVRLIVMAVTIIM